MKTWQIWIRDLGVDAFVGVSPQERMVRRPLLITIELTLDADKASASDDLDDTVDYKAVRDEILACLVGREFRLLETVAGAILQVVTADRRIASVNLSVCKVEGLRLAGSVGVRLSWTKDRVGER